MLCYRHDVEGSNGQLVGDLRHGGQHADDYWMMLVEMVLYLQGNGQVNV